MHGPFFRTHARFVPPGPAPWRVPRRAPGVRKVLNFGFRDPDPLAVAPPPCPRAPREAAQSEAVRTQEAARPAPCARPRDPRALRAEASTFWAGRPRRVTGA